MPAAKVYVRQLSTISAIGQGNGMLDLNYAALPHGLLPPRSGFATQVLQY